MDKLDSRTIKISDMPDEAAQIPKKIGRLGALWVKLLTLPKDHVEVVFSRDRAHAGGTLSHIRRRAAKDGRVVHCRRDADNSTLYLWLEPK